MSKTSAQLHLNHQAQQLHHQTQQLNHQAQLHHQAQCLQSVHLVTCRQSMTDFVMMETTMQNVSLTEVTVAKKLFSGTPFAQNVNARTNKRQRTALYWTHQSIRTLKTG